ncbi:MAG TPA: serine/threonine-protein kinase, partial [Planctomycetota bacterium]|nr:serine/threonine-protein kinase [Planctomycetota bacterium]
RRIESLERQLAELRASEQKARSQASESERRLEEAPKALPEGPTAAPVERKPEESAASPPAELPAAAVPAPVVPPPTPPVPKPEGSTTIRQRPLTAAEAASDPRNLFGPAGDDGRPRHVLLELLSRDALGVVYRACERATDRYFAVRFMSGQAGDEQTSAIEQEVELLIALPHPNILQVLGCGRRQNRLYVEMDLVKATPLGEAKIQEIPRICSLLRDAAEAVHYAHEEGIFHGDLHPGNVLVAREGEKDHALVKDFGLGHLLEGVGPQASSPAIRQAAYLPPEQMKEMKGKLSVAGDVYGLGATLFAALAGRAPFEGQDPKQILSRVLMQEPPPLEKVRPDVPEALGAIARRAMAKERSLRYESAKEMALALERFAGGGPSARPEGTE